MIGKLPSKTAMVRPTMAEATVLREATALALAAMTGTTGATAGTGNNSSRAATLVDTTSSRGVQPMTGTTGSAAILRRSWTWSSLRYL